MTVEFSEIPEDKDLGKMIVLSMRKIARAKATCMPRKSYAAIINLWQHTAGPYLHASDTGKMQFSACLAGCCACTFRDCVSVTVDAAEESPPDQCG
jgi:hypothetical protein